MFDDTAMPMNHHFQMRLGELARDATYEVYKRDPYGNVHVIGEAMMLVLAPSEIRRNAPYPCATPDNLPQYAATGTANSLLSSFRASHIIPSLFANH